MCFHINPATINESVTQGSLLEEASFTSLWQKPHLKKKKKFHTAAALLLQHVEMQCEKGIKPLMHKRKRGKKIAVTALAKPSYIHTLSNTHTRLCEILKRATGEGRGTTKGMKGRKSQAEGGRDRGRAQAGRKRGRDTEWKSYGRRERQQYTESQSPKGFFSSPKWCECLLFPLC